MKIRAFFITLLISFYILSSPVSAHAGVAQKNGQAIVTLYQSPISPFVGESVKMTFVVTDLDFNPLKDTHVVLTLIDTYFGDQTRDKKILTKDFVTDANGAFEFKYTFSKENYFDVDLKFLDSQGKLADVGYLVQARSGSPTWPLAAVLSFLFGLGIAYLFLNHKREKNRHEGG